MRIDGARTPGLASLVQGCALSRLPPDWNGTLISCDETPTRLEWDSHIMQQDSHETPMRLPRDSHQITVYELGIDAARAPQGCALSRLE